MSSELKKYNETSLEKNQNLFNVEVINFPKNKNNSEITNLKTKTQNFWKISDKSNDDQLKAVIGVCFMISVLFVMGLYSNLI
tara:strand:+ start:349 stop:594 length:246 start_codon:yes stop_codon:yes gene_type:complete